MNKKNKYFTGIKLDEIPLVLNTKEVSLILQIQEQEVIKLISKDILKTIPTLSELRIAAHSLFEFLHEEEKSSKQTTNGTGFVNASTNINSDKKVGFITVNQPEVNVND